jgi:hypothetical protein
VVFVCKVCNWSLNVFFYLRGKKKYTNKETNKQSNSEKELELETILYIKVIVCVCLSVRAVSRHCSDRRTDSYYPTERGGQVGGHAGKDRAGRGPARARGGTSEEGPGEGKLEGCIMHQVHTNWYIRLDFYFLWLERLIVGKL